MQKLNILFLNSWYPNTEQPFNGNFIQQHARAVSKYCIVGCLYVQSREQKQEYVISKQYNEGVFEVIVYIKKVSGIFSFFKKYITRKKAYKKGFNILEKEIGKIDITHLNVIISAGFFATYLKKKKKIPYIITEHSTRYLSIRKDSHTISEKVFIKKVIDHTSAICPVSDDLKKAMINSGYNGNYKVIPNVVNTHLFNFTEKNKEKPIRLLHISSLKEAHKNGKGILRVIKKLSLQRSDFSLTIISDGNLNPILEYSKELDLKDTILQILGAKTTLQIAKEMQNFDGFLLFSNFENSPCVISEALVMGLPVISSNVGGVNEMLSKENGILVEAGNEEQLLEKLSFFLDNISSFDNEKIAKNAKQKYSYDAVAKQYITIYNNLLKK